MILIVGPTASGKKTYAAALCNEKTNIVVDAHNLVPRDSGVSASQELIEKLASADIVTISEVGCGVHPLDHGDRDWRDAVGHLSAQLAKRADCVVRMCCGIPTVIKGQL